MLKAKDGIDKIAKHIAEHYKKFVEPLGFKAFIVAVDKYFRMGVVLKGEHHTKNI